MAFTLVFLFIFGYVMIALEQPLKINKAATALLLSMILWLIYSMSSKSIDGINSSVLNHMGDITEILFFLLGAMTIVKMVDAHGGFSVIANRIDTHSKRKLLWIIGFITFFMSPVFDNMTTAIVMTMLLRRLVKNQRERWVYAAVIIIAANAGGAWSPIGDVTTTMLWIKGNVTTKSLCSFVLLPSIVSLVVPILCLAPMLKGELPNATITADVKPAIGNITYQEKKTMFYLGIGGLLFVPVFKALTGLPPFIGMMISLSVVWINTDILYNKKNSTTGEYRVSNALHRIDIETILFFLGILMAVAVLQEAGILNALAQWLDAKIHNVYIIDVLLGFLSSIVDNVPLVAAGISMYPLHMATAIPAGGDYAYMIHFVQDGTFWEFLSYCSGVGGSLFIIGSAAGVVVMGIEKISFMWYMKRISFYALLGFLAGAAVYMLECVIFKGGL